MATGSNVEVLWHDPKRNFVMVPNSSSVVIGVGDLLCASSGKAVLIANDTDDATFAGVAMTTNLSGYTTEVTVSRKCRIRCYQAGIALNAGGPIAYVSGGNGTDYLFEAAVDSDAGGADTVDTIGWASDTFTTSSTYIEFDVDTIALGKLFAATA